MGEDGQSHALTALHWQRDPASIIQETGWAPGLVWMGVETFAPHQDSIPKLPSLQWVTIMTILSQPTKCVCVCVCVCFYMMCCVWGNGHNIKDGFHWQISATPFIFTGVCRQTCWIVTFKVTGCYTKTAFLFIFLNLIIKIENSLKPFE